MRNPLFATVMLALVVSPAFAGGKPNPPPEPKQQQQQHAEGGDALALSGSESVSKAISGSAGLPIPRWLSRKIQDCEAERDATWLESIGLRAAAIESRCSTRSMRKQFGGKSRSKEACVTYLVGKATDKETIARLRAAIKHVSEKNEDLKQELVNTNAQSDQALDECRDGRQRAHDAWVKCQEK